MVVNRRGFEHWNKWLPECASIRSGRQHSAEPEVWFRIVHITLEDPAGSTAYIEQTVEVALGPKDAFENGNIGTLMRRVPANQIVSAVPPPRVKPPSRPAFPGTDESGEAAPRDP